MDVYALATTFFGGLNYIYTDVIGVYTKLEDAMNAGGEIQKNNPETFFYAHIYRRRLDETPDDYRLNLALWSWSAGKWEEVNYEQ